MNPNPSTMLGIKILGVITARGGSKGIPGKNIKPLLGKPLIAYTIEAAKKSGVLDRIILTTDDEEIARVAKNFGCEVPFMRPAELAGDNTPTLPVLVHALRWLEANEGYKPDAIMILQPTSPLRQHFHIQEAVALFLKSRADSVVGVTETPHHFNPHRAMVVDENGHLKLFNGNPVKKRIVPRQALPGSYWNNTSIYLCKTNFLFDESEPNLFGDRVLPYFMDAKYAVDVDEPQDWDRAEAALKNI